MSHFDLVPLLIFTFLCVVFFFLSETSVLRFQDFYCKKKVSRLGTYRGFALLFNCPTMTMVPFTYCMCVCRYAM
ncbi:hypothetical protein BGW80DRAFT_1356692, partial [Lactifluus volemus]